MWYVVPVLGLIPFTDTTGTVNVFTKELYEYLLVLTVKWRLPFVWVIIAWVFVWKRVEGEKLKRHTFMPVLLKPNVCFCLLCSWTSETKWVVTFQRNICEFWIYRNRLNILLFSTDCPSSFLLINTVCYLLLTLKNLLNNG